MAPRVAATMLKESPVLDLPPAWRMLGALALAIALGWIAGTGNVAAAAIAIGALALLILATNLPVFLLATLFGGLVAAGLTSLYLPQFQVIRWGVAAGSIVLAVLAFLEGQSPEGRLSRPQPALTWTLVAFIGLVVLTSLVNGIPPVNSVIGFKSYFQVAGIFFALTFCRWPDRLMASLPRLLLWLALLQIPFALHQYFVLVPQRTGIGEGIVAVDVVAGTFGASEFGGGSNAVLSAFLLTVFAVLVALWNRKFISLPALVMMSAILLFPVMVNQSKISLIYLALIFLIVMKNDLIQRSGRVLASGALIAIVLTAMLYTYAAFFAERSYRSPTEFIVATVEQNFAEDVGHGGFYLNRWSSLKFWYDEHHSGNLIQAAIGHGPRASREGGTGLDAAQTLASTRYNGLGIGITGVSALLWETGIAGLVLVIGMFLSAFRMAGRLRKRVEQDPFHASIFSGMQAGVAIFAVSLMHKSYFVYDIGFQSLLMLLFGYLAYCTRAAVPRLAVPPARR